jgi:anti-sigma B factor antagonist
VDLTLATREEDGRAIVAVGGEIDVYTAPKLRDQITELVATARTTL